MARPGSPTAEDSSVGFDLLIGVGAFAATILVEALQARISVISGPAPAGFTGQFILGLTVLAALLFRRLLTGVLPAQELRADAGCRDRPRPEARAALRAVGGGSCRSELHRWRRVCRGRPPTGRLRTRKESTDGCGLSSHRRPRSSVSWRAAGAPEPPAPSAYRRHRALPGERTTPREHPRRAGDGT